ncbi:MAG TPA: hypothetical protein V6C81_02490 [Planktothrix sp.]|jgi:hypothetical protein
MSDPNQLVITDMWLEASETPGQVNLFWVENGQERHLSGQTRVQVLEQINQKWSPACERTVSGLTHDVEQLFSAQIGCNPAQNSAKQFDPPLGAVDGDIWLTKPSYAGGQAEVRIRQASATLSTMTSYRGEALDIATRYWQQSSRRTLAEIEAEINELLPPQEHADGDVWVRRGMNSCSVYVHWQERWQSYNTSASFRAEAMDIVRARLTQRCPRSLAQIESEVNELLPAQEHADGDVWVTRGMNSCSVYVHWQERWQSYNTSAYCRGQAMEIVRARHTQRCPRTLAQIESEVNELLPAQPHKDGDRWIDNRFGGWEKHWQVGWQVYSQSAVSKGDAERWLASGR